MVNIQIILCFYFAIGLCKENDDIAVANQTTPKDMYVVRATVYQVGILTNRTNESVGLDTGHQEALTIYHNNGSSLDLSRIPNPLLTNVTAEKVVGVASVTNDSVPWDTLRRLVSTPQLQGSLKDKDSQNQTGKTKHDATDTRVEIIKGETKYVIPPEAGVTSVSLPPLLALNKNLSRIPVPMPNMSVVSYNKVNTLVRSP